MGAVFFYLKLKEWVINASILHMSDVKRKIRVRAAPSPTGYVHIGNFRTFLFNMLFARHEGGSLILRIEDTDRTRYVEGAIEKMLAAYKSLDLIFDEGMMLDENGLVTERGEYGPYLQSKRLDLYQKHVQILLENKKAYYCFCSPERLDQLRAEQIALKKPPKYDGLCKALADEEVQKKVGEFKALGKSPVVRQAIDAAGETTIKDIIYGDIVVQNKTLDDQILLKSDGFPTYHLAVVVDDHFMEISHVIRGDEWISSTPKHVLLYEAFGWEPPQFAHLPLIVNPDKTKLSKRQGDVAIEDYLNKGYLKEALVNFIAFLGWNPKTTQEIFSLDELIQQFDLTKVHRSAAVFDLDKLDWINGLYIRKLTPEQLAKELLPYLVRAGLVREGEVDQGFLEEVARIEQDRLKKLSDVVDKTGYLFGDVQLEAGKIVWKKSDAATTKQVLEKLIKLFDQIPDTEFTAPQLEEKLKEFIAQNNFDNGTVLWPLRYSLTGLDKSPGPFDVLSVLHRGYGKELIKKRLNSAISLL